MRARMSVISDNNELISNKTNKSKPKYSFLKKLKRNSFFQNRTNLCFKIFSKNNKR